MRGGAGGVATVAALAWLMAALVMAVTAQPLPQSGGSEAGALVDPLRYLLVQRLLEARMPEGAAPVSPEAALARDLILLAQAAASDKAYHDLPVAHASIKTYCHVDPNRQCRDACLHLGDSACIDGHLAANGNDNAFLAGGFHPGK